MSPDFLTTKKAMKLKTPGQNKPPVRHPTAHEPVALYQQVKDHVFQKISSGEWGDGDRISSEAELVSELGVSRMTVNRALRELAMEGKLKRLAGVGTFVSAAKPQTTLLMIANIGEEIRQRGHNYQCDILLLARESAPMDVATVFGMKTGDSVFRVVCLHRENGIPVRLENRYVNPLCAPDFINQKFDTMEPSQYLLKTIRADEFEHVVDAILPSEAEAEILEIKTNQPCLLLTRRTWSNGEPVTLARFIHPGTRYSLSGRVKTQSEA